MTNSELADELREILKELDDFYYEIHELHNGQWLVQRVNKTQF